MKELTCDSCKQQFSWMFMLPDEVWNEIADFRGQMLCGPCIAVRLEELPRSSPWDFLWFLSKEQHTEETVIDNFLHSIGVTEGMGRGDRLVIDMDWRDHGVVEVTVDRHRNES